MGYKIFYSYQSDINKNLNEIFIGDALKEAAKQIKRDDVSIHKTSRNDVNDKIEIIKGFDKTSGQKPLAETMFDQSKNSDIFVGDVTCTMSKIWHNPISKTVKDETLIVEIPNGDLKPSPNPNVLIETGYSWSEKDFDRTILVMNTHFGEPKYLPVDMSHLRWPITYSISEDEFENIDIKNEIFTELVQDLKKAIKAALLTTQQYHRARFRPLKLHSDWKSSDFNSPFIVVDTIKKIIVKLRENLVLKNEPQRLLGPIKSGRTRIARELFRKIDSEVKRDDCLDKVLFYDLDDEKYSSIETSIIKISELNQEHVVIIDNCSIRNHKRICDDLLDTNIRILTIGEIDDGCKYSTIQIDKNCIDSIVKEIVNTRAKGSDANSIIQKSNQDISQAIILSKQYKKTPEILSDNYLDKWMKVIGTDLVEKGALEILEELSLFTHVGYISGFKEQSDFIINNLSKTIEYNDYKKIITLLASKNLVRITGDFIIIDAFISEFAENRIKKFNHKSITDYVKTLVRYKLSRAYGERLIELSKSISIGSVIELLTCENGIVRSYDFINSNGGACILMSLSEVAPTEIMNALNNAFKDKTNEELVEFVKGRRYLVWALERLCFRNETFNDAAILIYKLAKSENENFGNNTISQFNQLFQVYLSGTESDLVTRLALLKELNNTDTDKRIIINAIKRGLFAGGWTRDGGADIQAGIKLVDNRPEKEERISYWHELISLLIEINTEEANKVLIDCFYNQFRNGNRETIFKAIETIIKREGNINKELRQNLFTLIGSKDVINEDINIVKELINKYNDESISTQFKNYLSEAPILYKLNKDGKSYDESEQLAREFVKTLLDDDSWCSEIGILVSGEQRQTYSFGHELSEHKKNFNVLIDSVIKALKETTLDMQNNSLLEGYLFGLGDQDYIRTIIDQFLIVPEIEHHTIRLTRLLDITKEDLEKLYTIIEKNPQYTFEMQFLKLDSLSNENVILFFKWLKNIEGNGWFVCFDVCERLIRTDKQRIIELKDCVKCLILKEGILRSEYFSSYLGYTYIDLIKMYSGNFKLDETIVSFLSKEILLATSEISTYNSNLKDVLEILFLNYWDQSWPIIGNEMLNDDFIGYFDLKELLTEFNQYDDNKLLIWMNKYPVKAPQIIIHLIGFEVPENEWSPFVIEMLKRYGTNDIFLVELSAVLHSWFTLGSVIPLLNGRKELVSKLLSFDEKEVVDFANMEIKRFDAEIAIEKRREINLGLN